MEYRALARFAGMAVLVSLVSASAPLRPDNSASTKSVTVFKDPNCGCCQQWVEHLRRHSFAVVVRDTSDVQGAKNAGRVPERLHSCHTAFVGGYVVEGHVPATDIQRLLREKPKLAGIAVAGMPAGSPGMEMGSRKDAYEVIAFNRDGTTRVFARH